LGGLLPKAASAGVVDVDEVITVVDYDPQWPAVFAAEAARLRRCVVPPVTEYIMLAVLLCQASRGNR